MTERPPIVVGIDPGKEGGVCVNRGGYIGAEARPLPLAGKLVDLKALRGFILPMHSSPPPDLVAVEFQQAMPGDGFQSLNYLLPQYGQILGACMAWGWPVRTPKPRAWKAEVLKGTAKDKIAAVQYASLLYPGISLTPGKKRRPHDGMADALCIAEWALWVLTQRGGVVPDTDDEA